MSNLIEQVEEIRTENDQEQFLADMALEIEVVVSGMQFLMKEVNELKKTFKLKIEEDPYFNFLEEKRKNNAVELEKKMLSLIEEKKENNERTQRVRKELEFNKKELELRQQLLKIEKQLKEQKDLTKLGKNLYEK